jgi:hypothetical protein
MTYNTASELNHGPIQLGLKDNIKMEKRKASGNIIGVMDQHILEIGVIINYVGLGCILGQMGEYYLSIPRNTKVSGLTTK